MSEYRVEYSGEALDDLRSIYDYIVFELLAQHYAQNQVRRIRDAIRGLEVFPRKHPIVEWEPWKSNDVHKMPVDHYVVYYIVNDQELSVSVIRIFYGGRDIERIVTDS